MSGVRVLILDAAVGEGHVAAADALEGELAAIGDVTVVRRDGLRAFGVVARTILRDGYRWQLRWAPWSYTALYRVLTGAPIGVRAGGFFIGLLGRRRLRRIVRGCRPDVVVSTHPAVTCVLGDLRLRRRLTMPVCATVTDLADYALWAHPGADLHLVMHEHGLAPVHARAGADSAQVVAPLVAGCFREPRDPEAARAALGLADAGPLVVVSGGGWGVGDLEGAARAALRAAAGTRVIVLAARNEAAYERLTRVFADEDRVAVWSFTLRMGELMRAADALVHSTGGLTSLEALSCGCPLVAYGASAGHIRIHNRTLATLGLVTVADTPAALSTALRPLLGPAAIAAATPQTVEHPSSAELVVGVRSRVRPWSRARLAAGRLATSSVAATLAFGVLSTDDAYSIVARSLRLRPATQMATVAPCVGLIVRTPGGAAPVLAATLTAEGLRASFALASQPSAAEAGRLAARGDTTLPALGRGGEGRWLRTPAMVHGASRRSGDRLYLAPRDGLSLGQYLLARVDDASPVAGAVTIEASALPASEAPSLTAGELVVVDDPTGSAPALRSAVAWLATGLTPHRLGLGSLGDMTGGAPVAAPNAPSAGERTSCAAATTTQSRPASNRPPPSGVPDHRSPVSSGAASTGTTTCTTKTSGATAVAARRCSAAISERTASPDAQPVAAVHANAMDHRPWPAASATNFVDRPLQANAKPAASASATLPGAHPRRSAYGATESAPRATSTATSVGADA